MRRLLSELASIRRLLTQVKAAVDETNRLLGEFLEGEPELDITVGPVTEQEPF